jgi:hypothetical protein
MNADVLDTKLQGRNRAGAGDTARSSRTCQEESAGRSFAAQPRKGQEAVMEFGTADRADPASAHKEFLRVYHVRWSA